MKVEFINLPTGFGLANKLARTAWGIFYILFFKYSPRPLHAYRSTLLRLWGAKIGNRVHVYPKVKIWAPWNLEIGNNSGIGDFVELYNLNKIKIGNKVTISQYSYLCTGTHDYTTPAFTLITAPITVEDNAWLSAYTFVHAGITIAEGAVIGAKAVVTKNMPAWKICIGHPCAPIKNRKYKFDDHQ